MDLLPELFSLFFLLWFNPASSLCHRLPLLALFHLIKSHEKDHYLIILVYLLMSIYIHIYNGIIWCVGMDQPFLVLSQLRSDLLQIPEGCEEDYLSSGESDWIQLVLIADWTNRHVRPVKRKHLLLRVGGNLCSFPHTGPTPASGLPANASSLPAVLEPEPGSGPCGSCPEVSQSQSFSVHSGGALGEPGALYAQRGGDAVSSESESEGGKSAADGFCHNSPIVDWNVKSNPFCHAAWITVWVGAVEQESILEKSAVRKIKSWIVESLAADYLHLFVLVLFLESPAASCFHEMMVKW